jgi:hypothetical protein
VPEGRNAGVPQTILNCLNLLGAYCLLLETQRLGTRTRQLYHGECMVQMWYVYWCIQLPGGSTNQVLGHSTRLKLGLIDHTRVVWTWCVLY